MEKSFIDDKWLEELKSRTDIVSVISQYIKLERKGRNYWGCCPFHSEKTPSFCINDTEQFYHCFGCKESGDVIKFIEKIESCDFYDAVKVLADKCGMQMPTISSNDDLAKKKKTKERVLLALETAKNHYKENLLKPSAKKAQNYVKSRKITGSELEAFELGYSNGWTEMLDYMHSKGFTDEELKNAGIIEIKDNGHAYDVMAERLIFPIFNGFNDVIGFSARALEDTSYAKYKNTSQTVVFDKSNVLFGIQNIRKLKQQNELKEIILVEGQMDVLAMYKAGFRNTVATLGTALTQQHARMLKRYVDRVILCYDGDTAGIKATLRSIDILLNAELETLVAVMPEKTDPDEYIKEFGVEKLKELISNPVQAIDYKIQNSAKGKNLKSNYDRAKFVNESLNIISQLRNEAEKQVYLDMVKKLSGVPIDILRRDLEKSSFKSPQSQQETSDMSTDDGQQKAIKFVLASVLFKKEYSNINFDISKWTSNNSYVKLFNYLKKTIENGEKPLVTYLYDIFDIENEPNIKDIILYNFENNDNEDYYRDCIKALEDGALSRRQKELNEQFKNCTDIEQRKIIAKELYEISIQMKNKNHKEN